MFFITILHLVTQNNITISKQGETVFCW